MSKKYVLIFILPLLAALLWGTRGIPEANAGSTIYIRGDGGIAPETAPITSADNITYTFTDNINDSIVIERNNIVVNGSEYTISGIGDGNGVLMQHILNVTIKNLKIENFFYGIWLDNSTHNTISGSMIVNNSVGIGIGWNAGESSNNTISQNNISNNVDGIFLSSSFIEISENTITNNTNFAIDFGAPISNVLILENEISNNTWGIDLIGSDNTIQGNNITHNYGGLGLLDSNNRIFHNNFVNNNEHIYLVYPGTVNVWDYGYPSGGNYWGDYEERYPSASELDGSGLWDTPYVIDENNQDNYPLIPELPPLVLVPLLILVTFLITPLLTRKKSQI